jgi:hypothetical protein
MLQASENNDKCRTMFTMHDLAYVLANLLSGVFDNPCPLYLLVTNSRGKPADDPYHDRNLRALRFTGCSEVEFNNDWFSSKRCLRVLELKESSVQKLPDSICKLRHLGYLKITEFSGLATLPESLGELTNLFHIDVSSCSGLINLPESFGKLIRLVHVNLSGCFGLITLPESFGKLIRLVHVNLSGCSGLATLPESFENLVNLLHIDLSCCHRLSDITTYIMANYHGAPLAMPRHQTVTPHETVPVVNSVSLCGGR